MSTLFDPLIPIKDLRNLVFDKLEPWDMKLVQLAQCSHKTRPAKSAHVFGSGFFQLWCADRGHLQLLKHNEHLLPTGTCLGHHAAAGGHIHVLQWLKDKGFPLDATMYQWAAMGGHTHVLEWIKAMVCPLDRKDQRSPDSAAEHGCLPAMQWLVQNGSCPDERTCQIAACGGHLHVLEWLVANNCPVDHTISMDVARSGQLHVVQWLHTKGQLVSGVCEYAAERGQLHVLQWLKSVGCPCHGNLATRDATSACSLAAWNGHLEVLQWLIENGYPIDVDECLIDEEYVSRAGKRRKADIFAYLESLQ
jgi:hypothetical protein